MTTKEFNENELLFDELYEKTKDCDRVQFINLLMEKERENQELKKQLEEKESQQKEFLEYLKNKERQFDIMGDPINSGACLGISREYKKIIGVKDGKN